MSILNVIQLGFDERDDRFWWTDCYLWDIRDSVPDTVKRPTEDAAFRGLFRQSRLLKKRGVFINLSSLHLTAMYLEYQALSQPPYPSNVYQWVSARMHGVAPTQVKALLDECSLVTLLRDALGMPALDIDWNRGAVHKGRRAA